MLNPRIVIILSGERLVRKVFNPLNISSKLKLSRKLVTVAHKPSTHKLIALASLSNSNVSKNSFTASDRLNPNCSKSKSSAKASAPLITVFNASATVLPTVPSIVSPCPPSNNAFKHSAIPLPNVSNALWAKFQSIPVRAFSIPVLTEVPKFSKSNVFPNESRKCSAVFNEFETVVPSAPNSSGDIRPFKKSARPVPKLLAVAYTSSQGILSKAFVSTVPM